MFKQFMFLNIIISFGQVKTKFCLDKPILLFWVSELNSDNANLLSKVTGIYPDMPPVLTENKSF